MKIFILILSLIAPSAFASGKSCVCTCVVKSEEGGKFATLTGQGKDREAAGESLKKALGKRKCELSPDCKGAGCKLDE